MKNNSNDKTQELKINEVDISSPRKNELTQVINVDETTRKYITTFTDENGSTVEEIKTVVTKAPVIDPKRSLKVKINLMGQDKEKGKIKYDLNFQDSSYDALNLLAKTQKFILYKSNVNLKTVLCWEVNHMDDETGKPIKTTFNSNKDALRFIKSNLQEDDKDTVEEDFEAYSQNWSITKTTRDVPIQRISSNKDLSLELDSEDKNHYTDVTTELKLATVWSINPVIVENNHESIQKGFDGESFKTKEEAIQSFVETNPKSWLIVLDDNTETFNQQIVPSANGSYKTYEYLTGSIKYEDTFLDQLLVAKTVLGADNTLVADAFDPKQSRRAGKETSASKPEKEKKNKKVKLEKTENISIEESRTEILVEEEAKEPKVKKESSNGKKWLLILAITLITAGIGGMIVGLLMFLNVF